MRWKWSGGSLARRAAQWTKPQSNGNFMIIFTSPTFTDKRTWVGVFGSRRLRYAETFVVSRPPAISRSHSSGRAFCNCVSIRSTSANVSSMRRHEFNLCARGARLGDSATASLFIHHFQLHFNAMLRGLTWSISWRSPVSICLHGDSFTRRPFVAVPIRCSLASCKC